MRRLVLSACLLLLAPDAGFAAGLTQHQFMADIAYDQLSTQELTECIGAYRDAYLVGASFPDAGYAMGNAELSGDTHSPTFVSAFADHIQQSYPYPFTDKCRLISFLMGIASHVADDPPYHNHFIARAAEQDFQGDYDLAHTFCDTGLEFVTIVEHNRWDQIPVFWLPLADIKAVYGRRGSSYSECDIILGNQVLLVAAFAERLVTPVLYWPMKWIMHWTWEQYYDYPEGGLFNGGEMAAEYYEAIWAALMSGAPGEELDVPGVTDLAGGQDGMLLARHESREGRKFLNAFARRCLEEKVVRVKTTKLEDGSVILGPPKILNMKKFVKLLRNAGGD